MSSIHNVDDALLVVYLFVTDAFAANPTWTKWRTSNNDQPDFTDAEVLTIALMQGCLGCATLNRSKPLREALKEIGMGLLTPADVAEPHRLFLRQKRERIETVFSTLWDKFIDRVRSHSWAGLWNTILLKVLHYNLCQARILA